jgi:hypothetical protein
VPPSFSANASWLQSSINNLMEWFPSQK